ncbi:MAG TPA: hypothetical protein VF316_18630 [Polyangiaceae bacterium]
MRALLVCLALLAPSMALAEGSPSLPGPLPRAKTTPYPLAPPRVLELQLVLASPLDWNRAVNSPDTMTRVGLLGGIDIVFPFVHQRVRPSLFLGGQYGYWGDDKHGPVSFVPGAHFRGSLAMGDVFDFYLLARADFPVSGEAGLGFRPGLGFGLRAGRAVSFEASYDNIVAISRSFENTKNATYAPFAMTLAVSADLCLFFGCGPSQKKPKPRNLACQLYERARIAGAGPSRQAICDAFPKALDTAPDPLSASRDEDGVSAFLAKLEPLVASGDVTVLKTLHKDLTDQWLLYEKRAEAHALEGLQLAEQWSYGPVVTELRSYLGCPDSPGAGPPPKPATCEEWPVDLPPPL